MEKTTSTTRAARCALALGLALSFLAAGCSFGSDGGDPAGGATDLPGPVPAGVEFAEPPPSAPPAPEFTATLVDGTTVAASDLWADRPLVLVFTASWCGRCADLHRQAAEAVDRHEEAVGLLGIVPEDDTGADEYAEELAVGHPLGAAGGRVWLDYAAREPPVGVLVSREGRVLRGWPGGPDPDALAEALDGLVEGSAAEGG